MEDLYSEYKIYGPYKRKDGRKHLVLVSVRDRITLSYPKYLVEISLGRYLNENENIHHKDGDLANDSPDNLTIVDRSSHSREHAIKLPEILHTNCVYCGAGIILSREQQRNRNGNKGKGHNGPFCSKVCSGKYGTDMQY